MTHAASRIHRGAYLDSLLLMAATVTMEDRPGVEWAGAVMATPRGLDELAAEGIGGEALRGLDANDLVLAVRAVDEPTAEQALEAGRAAAFDQREEPAPGDSERAPRSIAEAVRRQPQSSVAIVSVPGEYAALEAHHALTAGLHVLLFSDGVPVEEEVELKERALRLGRLVMGPGAGTAVLGGAGLGFANVLGGGDRDSERSGRSVGIVAAAGTGAQEVSALLDRWGVPVSHVVGVGGRDLSAAVGARMARSAARALADDPHTDAILLVSKPPSGGPAAAVLDACSGTPAVAVFLGLAGIPSRDGVEVAATLERGAHAAAGLVGASPPPIAEGWGAAVASAVDRLDPARTTVQGLFSGGTLCYEAQVVLGELLGAVHSNEPLRAECGLPAPAGSHVLLDLGAEEYTRGMPHPMIDPARRLEMLRALADDPTVAVVLLDVVLGHGSHPDPASVLAPVCAELMSGGGPRVVAYVLGTDGDPQGYFRQCAVLEEAGCLVPQSNARAAYAAAALVRRRPVLAREGL